MTYPDPKQTTTSNEKLDGVTNGELDDYFDIKNSINKQVEISKESISPEKGTIIRDYSVIYQEGAIKVDGEWKVGDDKER